jgi:hypothetical protein
MSEISVKITKYSDREYWMAYYDDPLTGKRKTRSTRERDEEAAKKFAWNWEAELREGVFKPAGSRMATFRTSPGTRGTPTSAP